MEAVVVMQQHQLSPEMCESVIEKGHKKARELGIAFSFSLVDNGGHPFVFKRIRRAVNASIDLSIQRARTAALFCIGTDILGQLSKNTGPLYGVNQTIGGLVTYPGGIAIRNEQDELIGAIVVSGGTVDQDFGVSKAALM